MNFNRAWGYTGSRADNLDRVSFLPAKCIARGHNKCLYYRKAWESTSHSSLTEKDVPRQSEGFRIVLRSSKSTSHFLPPKKRCSPASQKIQTDKPSCFYLSGHHCCHRVPLSCSKKQILAACHKQRQRQLWATRQNQYNNTILTGPWWCVETAGQMTWMASAVMNNSLLPHQSKEVVTTDLLQVTTSVEHRPLGKDAGIASCVSDNKRHKVLLFMILKKAEKVNMHHTSWVPLVKVLSKKNKQTNKQTKKNRQCYTGLLVTALRLISSHPQGEDFKFTTATITR